MSEVKYILSLDPEQANIVSRACNLYARIRMGQLDEIPWELGYKRPERFGKSFNYDHDIVERALSVLKKEFFPTFSIGESLGIGHDPVADCAFNAHQILRYTQSWQEHPEGGESVYFYAPLQVSEVPIPECRVEIAE